ncbi:Acyl dehydratase [Patulibacter medicamentivorans]|uniref:Acyl dehydratase n=1 Tax=Patulibacter medicamentivorans TaxID=1097667 RepID=H0E4Y0_9ACTN|nr:MaoC/PaaZ C-terminal domain-containing protein [Patulibacter medicamentivorans]EHN11275.1 Acyl dehydratase [Patulibacter medicamentivorans]
MTTTRQLSSAPGTLGLYGRAALPMIPGASRLPFVAGSASALPDLTLTLPEVRVDVAKLQAYAKVCGFSLRNDLPVTYPFVLGFPLHMALMTDGSFPFPAIGLVHMHNRIVQHRPISIGETLSVAVRADNLQPHPKGRTFELTTTVRAGDELVWEDVAAIFRAGSGKGPAPEGSEDPTAGVGALRIAPTEEWRLAGNLGRRYGFVAGDVNPIHLHPLSAKLLGFPRAIAHGMWTKARSLAALQDRLPDAYAVDVRFQRPVLLPTTVAFGSTETDGGGLAFVLQSASAKATPHLRGVVAPA